MRGKAEAIRQQHRVARDFLGRIEILGEQRRRHHQRRARIREAFAGGTISGKLARGIERFHAREIAHRVSVFHIGKPPQHDRPRIARVRQRDFIQHRLHPCRELHLLLRGQLPLLSRRHFVVRELLKNALPDCRLFPDRRDGSKLFQIEIALLFFGRVAGVAMLLQDRLH